MDQKRRVAVGANASFHMGNITLGTVTTDSRGLAQVSLNASSAGTFPLLVETPGTIHLDGAGQVIKLVVASLDTVTHRIMVYRLWAMCLSCSLVVGLRWRGSVPAMRWRSRRAAEINWRRFKAQVDEMYEDLMK